MPARLPSSFSSDFRGGKSPARDIEYIEDDEEDEGEENGGGCAGGTGQGVTGKFTFQGRNSVDDSLVQIYGLILSFQGLIDQLKKHLAVSVTQKVQHL